MSNQLTRRLHISPLWHYLDFRRLWLAHTVSNFGNAITMLALPLIAVLTLSATPGQMGLLRAAGGAPILLIGLFAGVMVDRVRRRPLMLGADIGRAVLLGSIPVVALLGLLRMEYLYGVAFLAGVMAVYFDIAATSLLPSLVDQVDLIEGNSKLQMSHSVVSVTGSGIAGIILELFSASFAILIDALSFLLSAFWLRQIETIETPPTPSQPQSIWHDIGDGLKMTFENQYVRDTTLLATIGSFGNSMQQTLFILFVTRELEIGPALLGFILTFGGITAVGGAMLAGPTAKRFGIGPAILIGQGLAMLGFLLIPAVDGSRATIVALLILSQVLIVGGFPILSVNQLSLRQAVTPIHVLGRVNASRRFAVFGVIPLGALLAGWLGEQIGLRLTLWVSALFVVASLVYAVLSPLRTLRDLEMATR